MQDALIGPPLEPHAPAGGERERERDREDRTDMDKEERWTWRIPLEEKAVTGSVGDESQTVTEEIDLRWAMQSGCSVWRMSRRNATEVAMATEWLTEWIGCAFGGSVLHVVHTLTALSYLSIDPAARSAPVKLFSGSLVGGLPLGAWPWGRCPPLQWTPNPIANPSSSPQGLVLVVLPQAGWDH
ncbi:hypothetical protein QQF64_003959 [Cirrhinus molitorella]|uniref:Uncharacterized protein n=1 Tax=Cirrhinus molitorella TaxID=172907 RepID=A0ABR3MMT0_9TELE